MARPEAQRDNGIIDLQASIRALDALPGRERAPLAMLIASHFLEYAAYEMAVAQDAEEVSEIILMAARLDMAVRRRSDGALSDISAQMLRER
ncbi:hypothetical protein [Roseobacter sp.]|uniref:hypothetical protein n=1 Tax=Roseobacter sp. TaxID=1907202 RepID=UPI0025CE70D8|nr:hypothetical protein [Roseobacter sp.]